MAILASAMNQKDPDDYLPKRRVHDGKGKPQASGRDKRSKGRRRSHGNSITSGGGVGLSNHDRHYKPKEAALVYVNKQSSHQTYN